MFTRWLYDARPCSVANSAQNIRSIHKQYPYLECFLHILTFRLYIFPMHFYDTYPSVVLRCDGGIVTVSKLRNCSINHRVYYSEVRKKFLIKREGEREKV